MSLDANKASQCRRAAAELHSAAELAKATGSGSEYSGEVSIPDGAKIAYDAARSAVLVSFISKDGPVSIVAAQNCGLAGACEKNCKYRAYYDSGCRIYLG
jgi:hypothetical protein